jgi:murein DD-endopeptidase MepM/ murein hydrolase activator NlpD
MKCWPVPNSFSKKIPEKNAPGSFWKDRGDRYHCGIDIYAPSGSQVLSINDGKVIEIGMFTSSEKKEYWNKTYYILIKCQNNLIYKYAELGKTVVKNNEIVKSGQVIGNVGTVLILEKITNNSPKYIQELKKTGSSSMLHLEIYSSLPHTTEKYVGGNWLGPNKPVNLIDPSFYL